MLTTVRRICGRIMHSQTALRSQWDKGWKNNSQFVSPSICRPTHIGRLLQSGAVLLLEIRAYMVAFLTGPAEAVPGASTAQAPVATSLPMYACIIGFPHSACLSEDHMVLHLFGNGRAVLSQIPADLLERITTVQSVADGRAVIKR